MRKIELLLIYAFLGTFFLSCGMKEENEQLKAENARIAAQLVEAEKMATKLDEVDVLLDSIERARNILKVNLESGTSYDDFSERIKGINDYIANTQDRIQQLETRLNESGADNERIKRQLRIKRNELEEKEKVIKELQQTVDKYREENAALIKTVDLQKKELMERESEIREKRKEAADLEKNLTTLVQQSKEAEANAYFMRAQATEEAADRTKLAPKKKKETYKEAYDLYKKAFDAGKKEALAKMKELESKID